MIEQSERGQARGILKQGLLLIPNFVKLLYRLFRDHRVPAAEKAMLIGTIIYIISPLDVLPDIVPFLGQVDDLYLVGLILLRLLNRTPEEVLREHWDGGGDLADVAAKIVKAGEYALPSRIRHILLGRVEIPVRAKGPFFVSPAAPASIKVERERIASRRSS